VLSVLVLSVEENRSWIAGVVLGFDVLEFFDEHDCEVYFTQH
jgi:hypothetical protein